jgi:hypothetical protein
VRRGLLDTVPVDHAAGSKLFWLSISTTTNPNAGIAAILLQEIGRRAWALGATVRGTTIADTFHLPLDLGRFPEDTIAVSRRMDRPMPVANFGAGGYDAAGTAGNPATNTIGGLPALKRITDLDGALDFVGFGRRINAGQIIFGDELDAFDVGATFSLLSQQGRRGRGGARHRPDELHSSHGGSSVAAATARST